MTDKRYVDAVCHLDVYVTVPDAYDTPDHPAGDHFVPDVEGPALTHGLHSAPLVGPDH